MIQHTEPPGEADALLVGQLGPLVLGTLLNLILVSLHLVIASSSANKPESMVF